MATSIRVILLGITWLISSHLDIVTSQSILSVYVTTDTTYIAGEPASVPCTVVSEGGVVIINWTRSDGIIADSGSTVCGSIGAGYYQCSNTYTFRPSLSQAFNPVVVVCTAWLGEQKKSNTGSRIKVIVRPDFPVITEGPREVNDSQPATWRCSANNGYPAATLTWVMGAGANTLSGNETVTTDELGLLDVVNTLDRSFDRSQNPVLLTCRLSHDTFTNVRPSSEIVVTVNYAPIVNSNPTSYTVREGGTVSLNCQVEGRPNGTIEWTKEGTGTLDLFSGRFQALTWIRPDLTIFSAIPGDAGTYTCIGTNKVGARSGPGLLLTVEYKPTVTIPESSYSAAVGESVRLRCEVDATPQAGTITWYKGATEITTGVGRYTGGTAESPSLMIRDIVVSDAGSYSCRATNQVGSGSSPVINLQISYAPRSIAVTPTSVDIIEGNRVEVTCSADGVPQPSFKWLFNSEEITNGAVLVIDNATPSDNGQYTCFANNTEGEASVIVDVSVRYTPIFGTTPPSEVGVEGGTLTLKCNFTSKPVPFVVFWFKGGFLVDRSTGRLSEGNSTHPNLVINNVQRSDVGDYYCDVRNIVGVAKSGTISVTVEYPPENVVISPPDTVIKLKENEAITVTCQAGGLPAPVFEWKAGSDVISSGPNLVINSAGPADNRNVTCEVTNDRGSIKKTITINVEYSPRVTIPGGDVFGADEGQSLTVPCEVDANPLADTLQWIRDSVVLNLADTSKYEGGTPASSNLIIKSLTSTDSGTYSCRAVNSAGQGESRQVTVAISYKPENVQASVSSVTVAEGESILVTCSGSAVPSPTFTWLKEGEIIQEGPELNITSASPEDAGTFTCQVTNNKGTVTATTTVDVQFSPRPASEAGQVQGLDGQILQIPCNISANPALTDIAWVKITNSSEETLDIPGSGGKYIGGSLSTPALTITSFSVDDIARYQCTGENSLGNGSGPLVEVLGSFSPTQPVITPSAVSVTEGNTISVTCSANAAPSPQYVWLRNGEVVQNGATLSITSASPEDNANFTCLANNTKGSTESVISISVSYRPRSLVTNPVVKTLIGSQATLTCLTDANPLPSSYKWYFGTQILNETGQSLQITPTDSTAFGQYMCEATNRVGVSDPIYFTLEEGDPLATTTTQGPGVGASIAGMSTGVFILIILLIIILIVVIIVIIVICYKKGRCCKKKDNKGRVGPTAGVAAAETTPTAVSKPEERAVESAPTPASKPERPQWSAVSRKHVTLNEVDQSKLHQNDKLRIENEEGNTNATIPNGTVGGGPIISIYDPDSNKGKAHQLPTLNYGPAENVEKKKKRKKKRKRQKEGEPQDGEAKEATIDEEEEEEEE